jgi:hypothetical protein
MAQHVRPFCIGPYEPGPMLISVLITCYCSILLPVRSIAEFIATVVEFVVSSAVIVLLSQVHCLLP